MCGDIKFDDNVKFSSAGFNDRKFSTYMAMVKVKNLVLVINVVYEVMHVSDQRVTQNSTLILQHRTPSAKRNG